MSIIYVVNLTFIKPIDEVNAQVPAHVEWLEKGYAEGVFLASGPKAPRTGGVILAKSASLEELKARLSQDPFAKLGQASYDITAFEPNMRAAALTEVF